MLRCSIFAGLMLGSCVAYAQSSVTLYGIIDTGVEYYNNAGPGKGSFVGMPTVTGEVASRFGLKGVEDLGGGNKAFFNLESGFQPGTGNLNYGGRLFGRLANVGLSNSYGALTLGRQYNMTAYALFDADVLGPAIHSLASFDSYMANARDDNAIGYMGKFSNVTIGGTYSFGRDAAGPAGPSATNCPGQVAGNFQACKQYTALLKYTAANFGLAASYDNMRGGPGAAAPLASSAYTDAHAIVDGYFVVGSVKVAGGWIHRNLSAATASTQYNLYFLGANYRPVATLSLDAQVVKYIQKDVTSSAMLVARATYSLSKRTSVYSSVGYLLNGAKGTASIAAAGTVTTGANQFGAMFGIQQLF
ncbi:Outer membrane protein (porin) [Burkholderia sp. OK233]|nr:Outer membrane protein (porin) [Burkholderia sp. OK233]